MSSIKYYTGAAWSEKPLKYYNGSTWVEPTVKVYQGSSWFTIGSAAPDVIDATDYATADGVTDDTAALGTAAAAAISAGKRLYFPAGTYKVVNWHPPADLYCVGDGGIDESSHIKGKVRWDDGQTYKDLFIGDKTTGAIGPYFSGTGPAGPYEGTTFIDCKFRAGGSGNATLHHPAQGTGGKSIINRDITFTGCEWECNYISGYSQMAQDISWFVDRSTGDISDNIVFENCHFGTTNDDGRSGGTFGGTVFWSSWSTDTYDVIPDKSAGYYDNIHFSACVFERADIWNLDMSGVQYNPTSATEGTVYVSDCAFKGLSGAYHTEYTTRVVAQEEPGHDSIWTRNIFGIGRSDAMKMMKGASRSQFYGNTFDYRTFAQSADAQTGGVMIDNLRGVGYIVDVGTDCADLTIRDNTLLLPTGKYTSSTSFINDPSNRAVKSGNSIQWGAGSGPLANY